MAVQKKAERIPMTEAAFAKIDHTEIYWLGNGGAMINSRGTVILIDPLLKGFDMPIYTEAPLYTEEVQRADAVLITHCDNDHYSRETLGEIRDRVEAFHSPDYVAELMGLELGIEGIGHSIEECFQVGKVKVTLTPADHAWQNEFPEYAKIRHYEKKDYCGYRLDTEDGSIWMPGDSRLMEEQLHLQRPDLILMDISDGDWHIGLEGVKKLAEAYPDSRLVPIHWGCVKSDWKEFNGDPWEVRELIKNPERLQIAAAGERILL